MAKRELLAFEAPTGTSPPGGGVIYPATPKGAGLASTAASGGMVAVTGASIAWRTVIIASLIVAGTATVSVGIAAAVVLGSNGSGGKIAMILQKIIKKLFFLSAFLNATVVLECLVICSFGYFILLFFLFYV